MCADQQLPGYDKVPSVVTFKVHVHFLHLNTVQSSLGQNSYQKHLEEHEHVRDFIQSQSVLSVVHATFPFFSKCVYLIKG